MECDIPGKRLGNFSHNARRAFVGCTLVPYGLIVGNYFFKWGIFGRYGGLAFAISTVLALLILRYVGPTVKEVRDHRNERRRKKATGVGG
jgi:hypothetical protein